MDKADKAAHSSNGAHGTNGHAHHAAHPVPHHNSHEVPPEAITVDTVEVPEISAASLIDAGVHFGHSTRFWDPRMKASIFGKKNGIHVINIKETLRGAVRARYFLKQIASAGMDILIVGTKKQAADVVRAEASRVGMPFVATRWLGGCLTNHATVRQRLKRLKEIEELKESGQYDKLTKKTQSIVEREHKKIAFNLEGLRNLDKLPAALFVIDAKHEKNAVAEARKLNIPVICIVDTDSNPDTVDIAIPGNDDSLRGVQIILHYVCEGIREGMAANEAGQGLKDRSGLQISTYDDFGPTGREKRRSRGDRPGGGFRGGERSRPSGSRNEETKAVVGDAASEAVATAEAQSARPSAQVRVKGTKPEAAASAPAPSAPAAPAAEAAPAPAAAQ